MLLTTVTLLTFNEPRIPAELEPLFEEPEAPELAVAPLCPDDPLPAPAVPLPDGIVPLFADAPYPPAAPLAP